MSVDEHHRSHTAPQGNFTVLAVRFNAREYGSCAERERWWAVILDVPPSESAEIRAFFHQLLQGQQIGSYPATDHSTCQIARPKGQRRGSG